jgi:hypothetical protein
VTSTVSSFNNQESNPKVKTEDKIVVKKQRKKTKRSIDFFDEDALYFVLDKDEKEVIYELGLSRQFSIFD